MRQTRNMKGATGGSGTVYPSGTPESPVLFYYWGSCCSTFNFMCSFFLYSCLFFFGHCIYCSYSILRFLITLLLSSIFSCNVVLFLLCHYSMSFFDFWLALWYLLTFLFVNIIIKMASFSYIRNIFFKERIYIICLQSI